jgi:hypothetical protein
MVGDTKYFVIAVQEKNLHLNLNKHEQTKTVASSNITISELMLPSHTNFSGKYMVATFLLDQVAFASASKFSGLLCHSLRGYSGLPESYRSRRTSNNESQCIMLEIAL